MNINKTTCLIEVNIATKSQANPLKYYKEQNEKLYYSIFINQ